MVSPYRVVPTIAENSPANLADLGWCCDPARRFHIKLAELLKSPVLIFREQFYANFISQSDSTVFWLMLLAGLDGGGIVRGTSADFRALGSAIDKNDIRRFLVEQGDVRFASRPLHFR